MLDLGLVLVGLEELNIAELCLMDIGTEADSIWQVCTAMRLKAVSHP